MLLKMKTDVSEIATLCNKLEEFCAEHKISDRKAFDLAIIADEMATNVISYAYQDGQEHLFVVEVTKEDDQVRIQIIDDGIPFDPLKKCDPKLDESLYERTIGGLGIYLTKKLSKLVTYERKDEHNYLNIFIDVNGESDGN